MFAVPFGTSESFSASLSIYILATTTITIAVALKIFGLLGVVALIPFGHLALPEQFTLFTMGQVALLLAFLIGRASRRATLSALESHSQVVRELAARRLLHAVVGPEHLGEPAELDLVAGPLPTMLAREAAVIRRVPVLRADHEGKPALEGVRDGDDGVPVGNRQGAAGQKVVLDIHKD